MGKSDTLSEVRPKAVMTDEELAAWEALPASVQLERLRAAIDEGVRSGVSDRGMDEILKTVLERHSHDGLSS